MSKTDKTAPYYVKWFYEHDYLKPEHRHEFHDCDLPPKPTPKDFSSVGARWYGREGSCFWWPSLSFYRSQDARCPCYMCSYDAYESITRRKRQRIEGRNYCRDGWKNEY